MIKYFTVAIFTLLFNVLLLDVANATSYFLDNSISGNSDSNAGTSSGAPWATLQHAANTMVAGDVLYIGSHHSETLGSATNVVFASGSANPPQIYAVDDTNWSPGPYTPVTADLVDPSSTVHPQYGLSAGTLTLSGGFYIRGMTFFVNAPTSQQNINFGNSSNEQICERCLLNIVNNSSSSTINLNTGSSAYTLFKDLTTGFNNTNQNITATGNSEIRGSGLGPLLDTSVSLVQPTNVFSSPASTLIVDGVDLSTGYTNIVTGVVNGQVIIRNSKTTISTNLTNSTVQPSGYIHAETISYAGLFCDVHWKENDGTIDQDTANFRSGGAQCNSAGISYKMVGNTNASVVEPLKAPPIDIGYLSSGSSTTITLYFMFDGANNSQGFNSTTLNNNQIWMRVGNPESSTSPLATFTSNKISNYLPSTSPSVQGSVAGSWTTSGVTTPEFYSMTVTFTPQMGGHYTIWPEANIGNGKTIWIDPQYLCSGNCS